MRKSILFLTIFGAVLFMTSCLGEVSNNYADTTFVYLDKDDNYTVFGKTISLYSPARIITSNNMATMIPGTFKIMSYSWDEENGTKPLLVGGQSISADFIQQTGDAIDVQQTSLIMSQLPEVEDPKQFLEVATPLYADTPDFMGDNWIFQYAYEAPKGQSASLQFYKRDDVESSEDIKIDINITFTGTPEGATTEKKTDVVALNMSPLRYMYQGTSTSETKSLNIKFVYHLKDHDTEVESQSFSLTVKK